MEAIGINVGDKVLYKGHACVVESINSDGTYNLEYPNPLMMTVHCMAVRHDELTI